VAVLGYDADARDWALALARAGNRIVVGLEHAGSCRASAEEDGFAVRAPAEAVDGASAVVVVVREPEPVWRASQSQIEPGALVVVACAYAIDTGAFDDASADVVLVTGFRDRRDAQCRIAVHRDVSGRALLRAIGYAQAVFGSAMPIEATTVASEIDREIAGVAERVGTVLALGTTQPRDTDADRVSVNDLLGPGRGLA
jgi:ketol-acid reductoisomerase